MNSTTPLLSIFIVLGGSLFFSGCDQNKNDKYQISQPTKDGAVYRLNRQSGEVLMIVGQQSMLVEGTGSESTKTNHLLTWQYQLSQLGDATANLKTTWRDGKLCYIFSVSPYDRISRKAKADAKFYLMFYDHDGFRLTIVPISFSEMSTGGKDNTSDIDADTVLDLPTYQAIANWNVGTSGFD